MKKNNARDEIVRALALFTQLGVTMAACVFVGVLAGRTLDRLLGTSPVLLLVCSLTGAVAAFKAMYDMAIRPYR